MLIEGEIAVYITAELPAGPDKYSLERVLSSLTQERYVYTTSVNN
jgi:hypothetical protein